MKVFTADNERFSDLCRRLSDMVLEGWGKPDIVIGIRNGGGYVAAEMMWLFPDSLLGFAVSRRPSTGGKERSGMLKRILGIIPRWLLDMMRIVEARYLTRFGDSERRIGFDIPPEILTAMKVRGKKILVVDDAVDSGYTLEKVLSALKEMAPDGDIRSAVITVTTVDPVVLPDFTVFNNRVLVRFPWSMDAK